MPWMNSAPSSIRHRSGTVSPSEGAASNALARFDDKDIETGIVQYAPQ
jgi:hypothetical protein